LTWTTTAAGPGSPTAAPPTSSPLTPAGPARRRR
jgi:hypothetical protein